MVYGRQDGIQTVQEVQDPPHGLIDRHLIHCPDIYRRSVRDTVDGNYTAMKQETKQTEKQFDGQHDGEEVVMVFRRHPIALRKGFYALLIPFAVASIPVLVWPNSFILLYIAIGGLVLGMMLFFYHWVGWYFSIFIMTDMRIRQISQTGFFGKSVIDLGVSKIQNISYNIPGFTGEILGFGTIVVQTYVGDLVLDKIHHPEKIYNSLQDIVKRAGVDLGSEV